MKGQAVFVWLFFLMIFIVLIFGYSVMSRIYAGFYPEIKNITEVNESSEATSTISINESVWQYWPVVLLLGLFIWAFGSSQKREPIYYGA